MRRAALSIEGARISVAVARGMTVLKQMEAELPHADEDRTEALRELLSGLHDEHGVKGVVIGLEPASFTHTFIDLPVTSRQDVAHALTFELEKYLPLPPEEYVLDFHSEHIAAGGSRNLVLSALKEKLRWIADAFGESAVSLLGLRCTAFEVLNALRTSRSVDSCMYIYQGAASAAAITLRGLEPLALSFRPLGNLGDLGKSSEATVRQMMEGHDGDVFITGVEGTPTYTGEGVSTLKITPTDALLASGRRGRAYDMDFTPPELVPKKTNHLPVAMAVLAASCVAVFFLTSLLAYYKDYSALSSVQGRLSEIQTSSKGLVEIKQETEALQKRLSYLRDFQARSNRHILILRRLSRILPSSAWLTSFTANDNATVEIEGFAKRTADIIRPLEQSDEFREVEFATPVTIREGRERFSIQMKVEP